MNETSNILTDSFGREHSYLRISLIEKCNLRCTYCMPEDGVPLSPKQSIMTAAEVVALARLFVKHGVTKIRLTGGEPFLRKDFPEILAGLSQLDCLLSVTTNGILIDRYIDLLKQYDIRDINLSLDTLDDVKFKLITKRDQFARCMENIKRLIRKDFSLKLNVVLIKGFNDNEIIDFIELATNQKLSVRFIEFMPFDGNNWKMDKIVSQANILDRAYAHYGFQNVLPLGLEDNYTARNYQVKGAAGNFGIISTVTNPFCDNCNRIRLTANGKLKNCLFSGSETDLLTTFRSGKTIEPLIQQAIQAKKKVRAGLTTPEEYQNVANHHNRSMITIGG